MEEERHLRLRSRGGSCRAGRGTPFSPYLLPWAALWGFVYAASSVSLTQSQRLLGLLQILGQASGETKTEEVPAFQ